MKKNRLTAALVLAAIFASHSPAMAAVDKEAKSVINAASNAQQKIVVLDGNRVIEKSKAFQNINEQIKSKSEKLGEQIRKTEAQLSKRLKDLENQKKALSEKALEKKNEELNKKFIALQQRSIKGREALQKAYESAMQKLIEHLNNVITKLSDANKYDLIIDRNATQYFNPQMEVTDQVIEELNKTISAIKVDFAEIDQDDKADQQDDSSSSAAENEGDSSKKAANSAKTKESSSAAASAKSSPSSKSGK